MGTFTTLRQEPDRSSRAGGGLYVFGSGLRGVVWDWGDTLMRDIPGQAGPMAEWPRVEAMPGALAALEALSVLPVQCVATNATDSDGIKVAEALERVGLRSRLTHFFTSLELGHSKPDPEFFVDVSRKLRIPPEALMAIGNDLQKDIVPAKAVGMRTVLVLPDSTPPSHESADLILPSLSDLAGRFRSTSGGEVPEG